MENDEEEKVVSLLFTSSFKALQHQLPSQEKVLF